MQAKLYLNGDMMKIQEFVFKAKKQDKRNIFEKTTKDVSNIPNVLRVFYREANPVDVEISMDGNSVKFYPLDELLLLQDDYKLNNDCFIFATCNSDPIFLKEGIVYSCYHGAKGTEKEFVADSFETFLDLID